MPSCQPADTLTPAREAAVIPASHAWTAQQIADDVHADAARPLLDLLAEVLDVVAVREAVEGLLVDPDDAMSFERFSPLRTARAEEGVVSAMPREHQEELRDAAAEAEHVHRREMLFGNLQPEDALGTAPEVIGGGRAQGQGGDLPEVEPAFERRVDELPVADDGLLRHTSRSNRAGRRPRYAADSRWRRAPRCSA